jgi:hypothetical protein
MILPLWYAIVLGLCFIIFFGLLYKCMTDKRLYPNFSIFRDTISEVQDTSMGSSKYINSAFALMGIVLLPFPYYIMHALPQGLWTTLSTIILYCNPIGLIILSIWPNFTNNMHYIGAGVAMGGSLLSMIFLIQPILLSSIINDILIINIICSLIICIPLVYSNVVSGSRAKIMHNPNFWEWLEFFSLQTFILGLFFNLIIN